MSPIRNFRVFLPCLLMITLIIHPVFARAQPAASVTSNQSSQATNHSNLRINEISAKAARHFATHFISNGTEKWTIIDGFYIASYELGNVRTQAFYTSRGGFAYTVRYYQSDNLKDDIRTAIQRKFRSYSIDVVTEISNLNEQLYYIVIKTSSNIKILKIDGAEMEVTQDFDRAGS